MRLRGEGKTPVFLGRGTQLRLLAMIAGLGIVLLAMRIAAKPETWRRFLLLESAPAERSAEDFAEIRAEHQKSPDGLHLDEFRSEEESPAASVSLPSDVSSDESLAVDPELLAEVDDDELGVRGEKEVVAYRDLLSRMRGADPKAVRAAAIEGVGYAELSAHPDRYRGKIIHLEGRMKRLLPISTSKDEGEENDDRSENEAAGEVEGEPVKAPLYEAWIFTDDSGLDPYRIVCTEIPADIPQGPDLDEMVPVRVNGYFFKIERYAAQHGKTHPAPLILAGRMEWIRPTVIETGHESLSKYLLAGVLILAAGLGLALWRVSVGDRRFQKGTLKRVTEASKAHIDALDGVETHDTRRMLESLAAADEARDSSSDDGN